MSSPPVSDKSLMKAIVGYIEREGFPPSIRDLCDATGMKSSSGMSYRLDRLAARGFITRHPRVARGISVVSRETEEDTNGAR